MVWVSFRPSTTPEAITEKESWYASHLFCIHNFIEHIFSDPSATDLIKKFHEVIIEDVQNKLEVTEEVVNVDTPGDKPKDSAKSIALKILSLKVAAFLKWNKGKEYKILQIFFIMFFQH